MMHDHIQRINSNCFALKQLTWSSKTGLLNEQRPRPSMFHANMLSNGVKRFQTGAMKRLNLDVVVGVKANKCF